MQNYQYNRIRDIREDNDTKQETIARELKITRPQYQLYESGKREIRPHLLIKFCKYFNISADYILGLTDEPKKLYKE